MSIFVTSVGATDNEMCAPISQCILNLLNKQGFKFNGIPSVESHIHLKKNQVEFTLGCCQIRTSPITFGFEEVYDFTQTYLKKQQISEGLQQQVGDKLLELEKIAAQNCGKQCSCAHCTLVNG